MRLYAESALLAVGLAVLLATYAVVGPVAGTAATVAAALAVIITVVWPELEVSESSVISLTPRPGSAGGPRRPSRYSPIVSAEP